MDNSLVIESRPLSSKQATTLLQIIAQTQIMGSASADMLALRLSLERIASGTDFIQENAREHNGAAKSIERPYDDPHGTRGMSSI